MAEKDTTTAAEKAPGEGHAEVHEALEQMKGWLKPILTGAGIALILFIAVSSYRAYKNAELDRASIMLATAGSPEKLLQVVNQYPDSPSAPIALLSMAGDRYHSGEYDQAMNAYASFAGDYSDHLMAPTAELGKSMCLEALGQFEEGYQSFEAFIQAHPDSYLLPQAVFGKARCLAFQQRTEDARTVYEDFIASHPDSRWLPYAELALRYLDMGVRADRKE